MNTHAAHSHAYIIAAPSQEGYAAARALAKDMLCTQTLEGTACGLCENCRKAEKGIHPDIITVERLLDDEGKPKRVDGIDLSGMTQEQARAVVADAVILPNEAEKKVYIIRDAGRMNPDAQNALLKILEEPPRFAAFILVTDAEGALLETVRSRCAVLRCNGEDEAPSPEARERAERYLSYAAAGAKISLISFANEHKDLNGTELRDFVRATRLLLADMLCGRLSAMQLPRAELLRLTELMKTAEEYLRFNVSTKHVLGLLTVDTVREKL